MSRRNAALTAAKRFASQLDESSDDEVEIIAESSTRPRRNTMESSEMAMKSRNTFSKPPSTRRRTGSSTSTRRALAERPDICKETPRAERQSDERGWVLVDREFEAVDPSSSSGLRFYWPCKVLTRRAVTKSITLYGELPSGVNSTMVVPSSSIIAFCSYSTAPRFSTFREALASDVRDSDGSPSKRQRLNLDNIEQRWLAAANPFFQTKDFNDLVEDSDDDPPDLSMALSPSYTPRMSARSANQPTAGSDGQVDSEDSDEDDDEWTPLPADDSLEIPGELVLAKERRENKTYWPARIEAFLPSRDRRRRQGRYHVVFLDGEVKNIPRDFFFSSSEDRFGTCEMGHFDTMVGSKKVSDDDDASDHEESRDSTPEPPTEVPSGAEFGRLSIKKQFEYTKQVLIAILNEEYPPARPRHDAYLQGGNSRKAVVQAAGARGSMFNKEWLQLEQCLRRWCLKSDQYAERFLDVDSNDLEEPSDGVESDGTATQPSLSQATVVTDVVPSSPTVSSMSQIIDGACSDKAKHNSLSRCSTAVDGDLTIDLTEDSDASLTPPPVVLSNQAPGNVEKCVIDELSLDIENPSPDNSLVRSTPPPCNPRVDENVQDSACQASSQPRQKGCDGYEALSSLEKVDYCLNVLLPEAVIQILLWRSGKRESIQLMDPAVEQELHEQGREMATFRDWVRDVIRLRELKGGTLFRTK